MQEIKNGIIFCNKKRDVFIKDGKIVKSLEKSASEIIDCKDKISVGYLNFIHLKIPLHR